MSSGNFPGNCKWPEFEYSVGKSDTSAAISISGLVCSIFFIVNLKPVPFPRERRPPLFVNAYLLWPARGYSETSLVTRLELSFEAKLPGGLTFAGGKREKQRQRSRTRCFLRNYASPVTDSDGISVEFPMSCRGGLKLPSTDGWNAAINWRSRRRDGREGR